MNLNIKAFGATDPGLVREKNEDAFGMMLKERLFVLADGMGGHRAGDVAAHESVDVFLEMVQKKIERETSRFSTLMGARQAIYESLKETNAVVYSIGVSDPALYGMGTTFCCLYLHEEGAVYAHIGDSRIYRLRNGKLTLITKDHSLLHELIDLGQIDDDEAGIFAHKNIITKAIGNHQEVEPEVDTGDFFPDDRFLVCSDGLSDMVSLQEMEQIMKTYSEPKSCVEHLMSAAKHNGGHDNITLIVVNADA